ncbi:hypothetical protein IX51_02080 [uncultured archaeon]|nr:hypothetical protein IX51_02080 [uncultured archaeon]
MNPVGKPRGRGFLAVTAIWRALSLASVIMTIVGLAYATWFNQVMAGANPVNFILRYDLIVACLLLLPPVMLLLKVSVGLCSIPVMLVAIALTWTSFVAGTQLLVIASVFNFILLKPIVDLRDQRLVQKKIREMRQ